MTFTLPQVKSFSDLSQNCAFYSKRYCYLGLYLNAKQYDRPLKADDLEKFLQLINSLHVSINWFSFAGKTPFEKGPCCENQLATYIENGQLLGLEPNVYLARAVNFTGQDKKVNLIRSKFSKRLCVNIISEVGFGSGPLRINGGLRGAVFILNPNDKGIYFFSRRYIVDQLTFDWFKLNIMCEEQTWICSMYPPGV
ncbi:uncharacterized protein LOC142348657 [Convolutriloba macropyga]|uniref:uncharacterized protein LOC142348657 n=1 Tax=Convolutriloba macropyga TaxID=536237 RepID=UPI003F523D4B